MTQQLFCQFEGHEEDKIVGFCVNQGCRQIPQFCLKCIQDRHAEHVQECKDFRQYQELLANKLNEYKKELHQINEMFNQVQLQYQSLNKILGREIAKLQELIIYFNNKQYYDIKKILSSETVSSLNLTQNDNSHILDFASILENTLQLNRHPNFDQSIIQQPLSQIYNEVKAQQDFMRGQDLFNQQNYFEALDCFNESLFNNDRLDDCYRWKARTLNKLSQFQLAIQVCDKAIYLNEQNDYTWITKACSLHCLGKYEEALICCEKAIQINPMNETAYINKGLALGNLGRNQEELGCYDKVIEINKNNEASYINKCWTLNHLGKFQEAIQCCEKLIAVNPMLDQGFYIKGIALQGMQRYQEASIQFGLAYDISNNVDHLVAKADALFNSGQKKQSKQYYIQALQNGYHNKQHIENRLKKI
ncbi:unnamed protein product [Paramecium sonneborni]|uniref:Tetratricopeptide repeat protein n=1 Tax=Paramecium sonneborni TaxID=65129 RepID=A0A8S1PZP1_9CILI|nr:unnamed protein product [Paramecium sonneborni]